MGKIYVLRFRSQDKHIFDFIKNGKKTVETRANTARYAHIKPGDILKFMCGKYFFEKSVKAVRKFKTIKELTESYLVQSINPLVNSKEELAKMYKSFPGYEEKIQQFGIIAMEL